MALTREQVARNERMAGEWESLLSEARDLLRHDGRHVRSEGEEFPPCAGCDLEARIDAALDE